MTVRISMLVGGLFILLVAIFGGFRFVAHFAGAAATPTAETVSLRSLSPEGPSNPSREAPDLHATRTSARTATITNTPTQTATVIPGNIMLAASDICRHDDGGVDYTPNCKMTGDLVRGILKASPGAFVQTAGDNVNNEPYPDSFDAQYEDVYAPNWGSFLEVTHPAMGNHDVLPPTGANAYFSYFGAGAGPKPGGYYSYNVNTAWHIIVLNAECSRAGGCGVISAQYTWLRNDLAANTRPCVMAIWHEPRWTSGQFADSGAYAPWWELLYQYKADIVINGHNHNYERFDPIDPSEQAAPDGIREFIVGTGGAPGPVYTYAEHPLDPNEAIRNQTKALGVLQLTLDNSSYSWKFLPVPGYSFTDAGTADCH